MCYELQAINRLPKINCLFEAVKKEQSILGFSDFPLVCASLHRLKSMLQINDDILNGL